MSQNNSIAMDTLQLPQSKSRSLSVSSRGSYKGPKLAVQAKNVRYCVMNHFQLIPILDNLNLNLEVGTIYGLLGPSGCGKTTFLRCLIGFQKVTSGEISLFGYKPRDELSGVPGRGLGYMPQDLALHEYLTIEEELTYFGNLYMIDSDTLKKRIDLLVKSLDLPEKTRLLTNLSGGQRRRVSFALTVVHKPRLMILDEPTVGCDPILRERIWESLVHFANADRMSIIITTHYIEEARRSHRIGFMREGQILREDSPTSLMEKMSCDTLEKVFLEIVMKKAKRKVAQMNNQLNNNYSESMIQIKSKQLAVDYVANNSRLSVISDAFGGMSDLPKYEEPLPRIAVSAEAKLTFWYFYLTVIIQNIMIQIKRSPTVIIAQFVIPLICLMCFSMLIGHTPHGIKVGIINEEKPANLSIDLIDSCNKYVLRMMPFENINQVKLAAKQRHIYGWIHFKPNFTQALIERYALPEIYENETQLASTVVMHLDVSHWPLSITVRRAFQVAFIDFLDKMMIKLGKNPQIARIPVDVPEVIFGTLAEHDYSGFREFVSVGVLVIMSYTIAFGVTVLVVIQEKTSLIFERNYAAGVTTGQLIMGHLLTRVSVQIVLVIVLFTISLTVFEVPQRGSWLLALGLLTVHSFTGACHGIFTSAMSDSLFAAAIISNAVLIFLFIIGGILWPYDSLPYYFKWIAIMSPTCLPTESLRGILVRGWTITHPSIYSGFMMATGWALIFLFASMYILRYGSGSTKS